MSIFNIPYPRASIDKYVKMLALISASIAFILIILQPFGTASFKHEYKFFILTGYSLIIFLVGISHYWVVDMVVSDTTKDKWSIGHEIIFLIVTILLCQIACYMYWLYFFGHFFSFSGFIVFLVIASIISAMPVGFYLLIIFLKYREVKYAIATRAESQGSTSMDIAEDKGIDNIKSNDILEIAGTGKKEKYIFKADEVRMIKAQDNYVIIYKTEKAQLKKLMLRSTMNEIEKQMNSSFIRVHRSFIINKMYVENIEGNVGNAKLKIVDIDEQAPVSRSKISELRNVVQGRK